MINQVNMTPSKETNITLVTNHKEMELYQLPDKEFKIIILQKLNKMQEDTGNQTK